MDAQATGIARLLLRDGEVVVRHPPRRPFEGKREAAPPDRPRLVEQEAVAGIGDSRHADAAGGEATDDAADRHVRVHQIEAFVAQHAAQFSEGPGMGKRVEAARQGQRDDPEPLRPWLCEQGSLGTHPHDLVPAITHAAHQRQQEMPQREIDVDDLGDLQGFAASTTGGGGGASATTRLIAHCTVSSPGSAVSTTCWLRRASPLPR